MTTIYVQSRFVDTNNVRKVFVDITDKIVINTFGKWEVTQKSERTKKNQTPDAWKGELKVNQSVYIASRTYRFC